MARPIHYSGGVLYRSGRRGCTEVLPGWPACCSGDRAYKIKTASEQSREAWRVTCKRCLTLIQRHKEDAAEFAAHHTGFAERVAFQGLQAVELETINDNHDLSTRLTDWSLPGTENVRIVLTPREAVRLGRILVAWGETRGCGRG